MEEEVAAVAVVVAVAEEAVRISCGRRHGQHRGAANQAGVQGGAEERGDEQKSN